MLNALRRNRGKARLTAALHAALNAQARQPAFFLTYGVADTIDGRFDMVALHAWMVLSRLKAAGRQDVADSLTDTLFAAFNTALRELGTGDMGLGPRMKKLGNALNGRVLAYDAAKDEAALADAVRRNVYRGEPGHEAAARALARYALAARARLEQGDIASGALDFGPVPPTWNEP
ncbi:MAG TPA: ubiquinol-cytochrome C chaperone family protein [Rhizomicrobium sp.]